SGVRYNQTARNVVPAPGTSQSSGPLAHVPGAPHPAHAPTGQSNVAGVPSAGPAAGHHLVAGHQLTMAKLASLTEDSQRDVLGNRLFPLVYNYSPENASKLTGMLLEMDSAEVIHVLESEQALKDKLDEAMAMIQARANASQKASAPSETAGAGGDSSKATNAGPTTSSILAAAGTGGSATAGGSKETAAPSCIAAAGKTGKQTEAK
ncbi:unnamed protein product, partial [Protopolystoma xenopodis]